MTILDFMSYWILYNVFRFESLIQGIFHYPAYVLFERPLISNIVESKDQNEMFRIRMVEFLKNQKGTLANRLVNLTLFLLILSPWNLICGFLLIENKAIWLGAMVGAGVVAFIVVVKADKPSKYLKDFKKHDLKSMKGFRRSALVAFLIMLGIWSISVLSFSYFFLRIDQ